MQGKCLNWKVAMSVLAAILMLTTDAEMGRADAPLAKTDTPQPLPENIVTAWEKAGAEVGWLRLLPSGLPMFVREKEGKPGDLPSFRFADWQEGRLAKLPAPTLTFGLDLTGTKVTDAGLEELAGLKNLQALYLSFTQVTDGGLKELAGLKSLQTLSFFRTQVTDAAMKKLVELKSLRAIDLGGTKVTDAGLKELTGLTRLQSLGLFDTKVTDAGLKELAGLNSLQALNLASTQITDGGLKELVGLKSLQTLNLLGTQVTDAGLQELQKSLPECKISR